MINTELEDYNEDVILVKFSEEKFGEMALIQCLKEAQLEKYYPKFQSYGITQWDHLSQISMEEYSKFGITSMEERLKLFRLVQVVKIVHEEKEEEKNKNLSRDVQKNKRIKNQGILKHEEKIEKNDVQRVKGEEIRSPHNKAMKRRMEVNGPEASILFDCKKQLNFSDAEDDELMNDTEIRQTESPTLNTSSSDANLPGERLLSNPMPVINTGYSNLLSNEMPKITVKTSDKPVKRLIFTSDSKSKTETSRKDLKKPTSVIKKPMQKTANRDNIKREIPAESIKIKRPPDVSVKEGAKTIPMKKVMHRKYSSRSSSDSDSGDVKNKNNNNKVSSLKKTSHVVVKTPSSQVPVDKVEPKLGDQNDSGHSSDGAGRSFLKIPKEPSVKTSESSGSGSASLHSDNSIPISALRRLNINAASKNPNNAALIIEPVKKHAYFPHFQSPAIKKETKTIEHYNGYDYGVPQQPLSQPVQAGQSSRSATKIRVCVRKRPLSKKEVKDKDLDVVHREGLDAVVVEETKSSLNMEKFIQKAKY